MAQDEDRGLVYRGLFLVAGIGLLVVTVLAIILWRPQTSEIKGPAVPPEQRIPLVAVPSIGDYPANVPWLALADLSENLPSGPGWEIRYNAAATLARRGDDEVPWHRIREMLDEKQQMRNNLVRHPDGHAVYDEAAAHATMVTAMRALATWHEKQKAANKTSAPSELREIYAMVDRLADSPYVQLKVQAEKTRGVFFR
jgi:hypothetical protein